MRALAYGASALEIAMPAFDLNHSHKLDWAITCMEASRGWRRRYWRMVKAYYELWI